MDKKLITSYRQELAEYCRREIIACHCDKASCSDCPANRAFSEKLVGTKGTAV